MDNLRALFSLISQMGKTPFGLTETPPRMKNRLNHLLCLALLVLAGLPSKAQLNINLLGQLTYSDNLSDIWGWHDAVNNKEYALVGVFDGLSIVDVTIPTSPTEVQFFSGPGTTWRDIKEHNGYAYCTNEGDDGLLIVDMNGTPGSWSSTYYTNGGIFATAHNIYIDENGYAYLCGGDWDGTGGVYILDLNADPWNPPHVGTYDQAYVHDLFVRGDTMWTAEIYAGAFRVVDVTSKATPIVMATQSTSSDFTHNIWVSDDGNYAFTTDEVSDANVDAFDVRDLSDISAIDVWQSNPGSDVIPHNTFVRGNWIITSYYRDGVTITDVTVPSAMVQTGSYDTSPLSGDGFNGCWGVYPYLPSGNIIASDIENGLFVLGPTYVQACYLQGTVVDSVTGAPIFGATVEIIGASDATPASTGVTGEYGNATLSAGTYDIRFSAPGYTSRTTIGVALSNGAIVVEDRALPPLTSVAVSGTVIDSVTSQPVPFAHILLENAGTFFEVTADADGIFSIPSVFEDNYNAVVGQWGYRTKGFPVVTISSLTGPITFRINKGWYDDYIFDFDWSSGGTGSTGLWVREDPIGTTSGGQPVNSEDDVPDDFGTIAYVTGNDGGGAGNDDIDDGYVLLASPVFDLSGMGDPRIKFRRWFYNGGGSGAPNDSLIFRLGNGSAEAELLVVLNGDPFESQWREHDIKVSDFIGATDNMRFTVHGSDFDPGHLVEGGIDRWLVYDAAVTSAPSAAIGIDAAPYCGSPLELTLEDNSTGFPVTHLWEAPGATPAFSTDPNPTFIFPAGGSYTVSLTVYNGTGVSTTSTTFDVFPGIDLTTSSTGEISGNDGTATVNVSGGTGPFNILWSDLASQTTATATGLDAGTYEVTVTDANGCTSSASVVVDGNPSGLDQPEIASLEVFPNPFRTSVTVRAEFVPSFQAESWTVYDVTGRVIESGNWQQVLASGGSLQIGQEWPAGSYLLEWRAENGQSVSTTLLKSTN